jgi:hypothetical protein
MVRPELHARASASPALRSMQSLTSETALSLCSRLPLMALTARSLHCRDSVRLHSYFHRTGEPVSTPARDPKRIVVHRFKRTCRVQIKGPHPFNMWRVV